MLWCSATQYRVKPRRSAACASATVAASASEVDWSVRTGTRSRTERRTMASTHSASRTFPGALVVQGLEGVDDQLELLLRDRRTARDVVRGQELGALGIAVKALEVVGK